MGVPGLPFMWAVTPRGQCLGGYLSDFKWIGLRGNVDANGDVDAGRECSDKDKERPLVKTLPQAQRPAAGERLAAGDT
eukprot:574012-Prymnesium_polylepis.1